MRYLLRNLQEAQVDSEVLSDLQSISLELKRLLDKDSQQKTETFRELQALAGVIEGARNLKKKPGT